MKKVWAVLMAVMLLLSLSACAGGQGGTSTDITAENIKVGVIHITSKNDTAGYTYAHQSGVLAMQKELGLKDSQLVIIDNVDDTDVTATQNAIQQCIDAGCNIIFGTSYNYMNTMEQYANNPEYADIIFSHCSGSKSNKTNFNNYFGRIYEARYLSGIAAGLRTQTNKIGYVAAMDVNNAEVTGGINAFALGVQSVNPDAEVLVSVTGSWYDPVKEKASAEALIAAGCDVLAQHADSDMVQTTAAAANIWGCGYNSDMTTEHTKNSHLCAPIWNWGSYYTSAVKAVIDGTWKAENYYEGMNVGLVGLSPLNTQAAAAGTQEKIDEMAAKIKDGSFFVFSGPLYDNKGNQILAEGEKLTDAQITVQINYYIQGVDTI